MKLIEWLINKGYDRKTSESLIKQGKVLINWTKESMINYEIKSNDCIKMLKVKSHYVSRGSFKLLAAIESFSLDFKNKIVLDIGSSTGGFSQVALEKGAKKVYAVDVGKNQLDFIIRRNKKVVVMEKTNLKSLKKTNFEENIDIVVCDVSFISLEWVFKVLKGFLSPEVKVMALIKPQYEASSSQVENGGFVKETLHDSIIKKIKKYALKNDFIFLGLDKSPIKGKNSKNQEYLSLFERN